MLSSSKSHINHHTRSISLPCRPHPTALRIEELKTWEASSTSTAETICNGLSILEDLHKCLDDLLNLPLSQHALPQHANQRWASELLDGSLRFLDMCGISRDLMSQTKEHTTELQSSLRRRKGDKCMENSIAKYTTFRRKLKKDSKNLLDALKQMENKIENSPLSQLDHHASSISSISREVSVVSFSVFRSLFLFLSTPVPKPKSTRWSLVSQLVQKRPVAMKSQIDKVNEVESVDAGVCNLCTYGSGDVEKMQVLQSKLESLVPCIEEIEKGLECMFRHLIRTRASFLNIISH